MMISDALNVKFLKNLGDNYNKTTQEEQTVEISNLYTIKRASTVKGEMKDEDNIKYWIKMK